MQLLHYISTKLQGRKGYKILNLLSQKFCTRGLPFTPKFTAVAAQDRRPVLFQSPIIKWSAWALSAESSASSCGVLTLNLSHLLPSLPVTNVDSWFAGMPNQLMLLVVSSSTLALWDWMQIQPNLRYHSLAHSGYCWDAETTEPVLNHLLSWSRLFELPYNLCNLVGRG